jgi:DNA-binding MarR family transcriptional regulator
MSPISPAEFADRLSLILPVMMKEFSKQQSEEIYQGKITLPQFFVMDFLMKNESVKMSDLAIFMDVSMATMTGIVDRLVRHRYVGRISDAEDRRIIRIRMTRDGTALMNRVYQRRREMIIEVFGQISASDRDDYLRILSKIRDILLHGRQDRKP